MKRTVRAADAVMLILCMVSVIGSCETADVSDIGNGEVRISFHSIDHVALRSVADMPDTSDFILSVRDSEGNPVYEGKYGDCPEILSVRSGNYMVSVMSSLFRKPAFSSPLYGDEQCIVVGSGEVVNVRLLCRQLNSGIRLRIASDFLTAYPNGTLFLSSSSGKLMYSYSEKRIAYFPPGSVSLMLSNNGKDEILMTRDMKAQDILVLGVDVSGSQTMTDGISIAVDTTRNWINEKYTIGSSDSGQSPENALSVAQAISISSMSDVWVSGYIVGGDLTSSSGSFDEPFKSRTNLILGPRSTTSDRKSCIAVQLQSGTLRDELNLVDNPSMLGRKICLRGDLVSDYFNLVGLKNLEEVVY